MFVRQWIAGWCWMKECVHRTQGTAAFACQIEDVQCNSTTLPVCPGESRSHRSSRNCIWDNNISTRTSTNRMLIFGAEGSKLLKSPKIKWLHPVIEHSPLVSVWKTIIKRKLTVKSATNGFRLKVFVHTVWEKRHQTLEHQDNQCTYEKEKTYMQDV